MWGRAVAPGMAKFEQDATLIVERKALGAECGARDIAAEVLELAAAVGPDGHPGVQREALVAGRQLRRASGLVGFISPTTEW